jgi:hypothetical protein
MPPVGFKPMTPAFEWVKTVHGLNRATTVIGRKFLYYSKTNATIIMIAK